MFKDRYVQLDHILCYLIDVFFPVWISPYTSLFQATEAQCNAQELL
jgi:hypothetical protein